MVRNLWIENVTPPSPTRSCRKNAGPGLVTRTASAITTNSGEVMARATAATTTSKARLTSALFTRPILPRSCQQGPDRGHDLVDLCVGHRREGREADDPGELA